MLKIVVSVYLLIVSVITGYLGTRFQIVRHRIGLATLPKSDDAKRNRLLADLTVDAVILHDNGAVLWANHAARPVLGYEPGDLLNRNAFATLGLDESMLDGRFAARVKRQDGSTFAADIHSSRAVYQGRPVRILSIRDVTSYQQTIDALQQQNTQLERHIEEGMLEIHHRQTELNVILETIGEGVFYSEGPSLRYVNPALLNMTGYSEVEVIGKRGGFLLDSNLTMAHQQPEFISGIRDAAMAAPDKVARGETHMMRKDGTTFDAALTFSLLTNLQGQITGSVSVVRNITEEKRLEAQKANFVANASHELRTPLTNIKMRLYLLRRQPEKLTQHLDVLDRVCQTMTRLVEDLLDSSRFERGIITLRRREIAVQDIVQEVIQTLELEAQQKEITLDSDLPALPTVVSADPDRLRQVIVNLVDNAIHYTPQGGHVLVELDSESSLGAVIRISDSGIGIDPKHFGDIFEPFFRVNEGTIRGTGLGLSISKTIAELHGGSLTVDSQLQVGSTFALTLPRIPHTAQLTTE